MKYYPVFPFDAGFQELNETPDKCIKEMMMEKYGGAEILFSVIRLKESIEIQADKQLMCKIYIDNSIEFGLTTIEEHFCYSQYGTFVEMHCPEKYLFKEMFFITSETSETCILYEFKFKNKFERKSDGYKYSLDKRKDFVIPHPDQMLALINAFYILKENARLSITFNFNKDNKIYAPSNVESNEFKQLFLHLIPDSSKELYSEAESLNFILYKTIRNDEIQQLSNLYAVSQLSKFKCLER